eukprot:357758-Chlamydomonas_euryale.AAC.4
MDGGLVGIPTNGGLVGCQLMEVWLGASTSSVSAPFAETLDRSAESCTGVNVNGGAVCGGLLLHGPNCGRPSYL